MLRNYIAGKTLDSAIKFPVKDLSEFFEIVEPLLIILLEVHKKGLIHRDLKPQNIIYEKTPDKKVQIGLIDFQISCRINTISEHNVAIGTFQYMAPEQTGRISRPIDYRTDLYSIGVIFYELLTGKVPFSAKDPLGFIHAHVASIPERVETKRPDIPPLIADMVKKLLAKNSDDRYQSTEGLLTDIRKLKQFVLIEKNFTDFICGEFDHSLAPIIPHKLYGRDIAIQTLPNAFIKATAGRGGVVLVSGQSGCGKTSLVRELRTQVATDRGYYIEGKCDLLARDVPYAVFWELCQGIIRQILVESEQAIAAWKERIKTSISALLL